MGRDTRWFHNKLGQPATADPPIQTERSSGFLKGHGFSTENSPGLSKERETSIPVSFLGGPSKRTLRGEDFVDGLRLGAIHFLKLSFAKRMHATQSSSFWQKRYYDRNVRDAQEFTVKLRYLQRNPGGSRRSVGWPKNRQ
jgi:hypothetical protein